MTSIAPELVKPTKNLDHNYSGQYDLILDEKIRVEVKASRAVDSKSEKALYLKALLAKSDKHFVMNFQQVKPGCCDVVVWVGVWRDIIRYWVLSSDEVSGNRFFSDRQHRGNTGEGQLHLKNDNIAQFSGFESNAKGLAKSIREAYTRQKKQL